MGYQPLPHTIVDLDMIGSGRLANDPLLLEARSDIRRLTAATLAQQGIDFAALPHQDLGDGLRVAVPGVISPAALIDPFIRNVDSALRQHRQRMSEAARLRLRIAIHHGLLHQDGVLAGEPLRVVARLLDAAPVRQAAAITPEANLVLVVSRELYENVVRHGYGLDPAAFQPIVIAEKELRETAWLFVPGVTPHLPLERGGAHAGPTAQPPMAEPAGRAGGTTNIRRGDVQAGRDVITVEGTGNQVITGNS